MAELKMLRRGDRGAQVELLQLALTRAGYRIDIDGIFGEATERALNAFQKISGLQQGVTVSGEVWSALDPYLTGYDIHTVRKGDTFYGMAAAYGTTVSAIETANPGVDPYNLKIGEKITIPLSFDVVPMNVHFTSTVLELCVRGLRARYPFIMTGSAGHSVMGGELYWLSMGKGERQVFYNAAHHANEWITCTLLMKFLEKYAAAYANGGLIYGLKADELFERATLYAMPMVNPDGVDLVCDELSHGRYYDIAREIADNYPNIPFPGGWKANISGVDTNLQYPAGWEQARRIKFEQGFTAPAPRDYVGSNPLTAPESRAVYNFTRRHDFSITVSYHTQGRVIYWQFLDYDVPRAFEIAELFSGASGYEVADVPYESSFAGYKDWFIQTYDRPGFTVEAGIGEAPLPISQFGEIFRDNIGILTLGLTV